MSSATTKNLAGFEAIHQSLAADIRQRILSGQLELGATLESESELCRRYNVSRTPVRQALGILAREGLIRRVQGKGSFVAATVPGTFAGAEGRSGTAHIAVLVDSPTAVGRNPVTLAAIEGLLQAVEEEDLPCRLTFQFHRFTGPGDPVAQAFLTQAGVDGLVVFPFDPPSVAFLAHAKPPSTPIVSLYRKVPGSAISQFYVDHERGAYMATDYLIRLGHRRIAFLSAAVPPSPPGTGPNVLELRLAGYRRALSAAGIEPDPALVASPAVRGGEVPGATAQLLRRDDPPTALLVGGGVISPHCLEAIDRAGIRIPDDLSVLIFDRPAHALQHSPQVGGIALPMVHMARLALDYLFTQMSDSSAEPVVQAVTPELHIHESCRSVA